MNTQQGSFAADSPFLRRVWAWGADGLNVQQSRSALTTVVTRRKDAKVVTSQANAAAPTRNYTFS